MQQLTILKLSKTYFVVFYLDNFSIVLFILYLFSLYFTLIAIF